MKNAKTYEKNIKKLLSGAKNATKDKIDESADLTAIMLLAILEEDATEKRAQSALVALSKEFVSFNELRVARAKEIVECIGDNYPDPFAKAHSITASMRAIFARTGNVTPFFLVEMTKKDQRACLIELDLSPFASALIALNSFAHGAIPVDQTLADCLMMNDYVHPDSELAEIQSFLERIINVKDAWTSHLFFRQYVAECAKQLDKWRKIRAEEKAAAQAAEDAIAAEKAEKEKARKAKKAKKTKDANKAAKKAEAKAEAKTKPKAVKKTAKKATQKKTPKPAEKKAAKPTVKKAKKTVKKTKK